jgi:hypothetical protein
MPIAIWFGLLLGTATLSGLFGGYFNKNLEFSKRFSAFIVGLVGFAVLLSVTPAVAKRELWVVAGLLTWMSFVVLGFYLGIQLRAWNERADAMEHRL